MKQAFFAALSVVVTSQICFGGVDYYSSSAVVANTGTDDGVTFWQPISGNTQFNVSFDDGGTGTNATLSTLNTTASGHQLRFTTASASAGFTYLKLLAASTTFDGTGTVADTAILLKGNVNEIVGGYTDTDDGTLGFPLNYFGWTASDGSTTYTGWANIEINPDGATQAGPGTSPVTTIRINEWAYNVGSTITVGDRATSNIVPEPTGIAIVGLVGLAAGLKRRKRR